MRTCLGCRQRDEQSRLLRVVGVRSQPDDHLVLVQPDPSRRTPGRGAYLHLDMSCARAAGQRRAFGRALRISGNLDDHEVMQWIEHHIAEKRGDQPRSPSLEAG
ncbi:MAG: YlxR family protein [Ornithinimicrobium sp.]